MCGKRSEGPAPQSECGSRLVFRGLLLSSGYIVVLSSGKAIVHVNYCTFATLGAIIHISLTVDGGALLCKYYKVVCSSDCTC